MSVANQDQKSQLKNKERALRILKNRMYDKMVTEQRQKEAEERRGQVGTGDRSEKIRTYNYKDNRTTDHRLGRNFSLEPVLEGQLEDLIEACIAEEQRVQIEELGNQSEE